MPHVKSVRINGCDCWFNTNDHPPPHFHLKDKGGAWEFRVFILTEPVKLETVFAIKRPPPRLQRKVGLEVSRHREQLLQEWEKTVKT